MGLLSFSILVLSGAYAILCLEQLPTDGWLIGLFSITCPCLVVRAVRPIGALLLGFTLMWVTSRNVLDQKLPTTLVGQDLTSSFRIVDFVARKGSSASLIVAPVTDRKLPSRIRLSWYNAERVPKIGECWTLTARLKRPRGFSNPAGFDYEGWLFRQEIGATGYVRRGEQLGDCSIAPSITTLRRHLAERLSSVIPDDDATAVIMAVTIGARHKISDENWRQFAITGTSHLMAISGLHIGLAAGGAFLLSWCLLALCHRSGNLHDQAAIIALIIAVLYGAVSGFAVPARRALTMLSLVLLTTLSRKPIAPMRILAASCIVLTLADPLAILAPGFQLSFAAVAVLFWIGNLHRPKEADRRIRRRALSAIGELLPLQSALLFGLLPLTAVLFGRVSWLAPFANLLALPIFNLVTVPASLLGLLLTGPLAPLGDGLIRLAWHSVTLLLQVISFAASLPYAELRIAKLGGIVLGSTFLVILWTILPASWPGRKLAWIAALGTLLHAAPRPPVGCADIHSLDVGQGLATVVITSNHTIVFDTGPSFRSGSDTGRLVLIPFLRGKGIDDVDLLVVSHGDNDHAGGVHSIVADTHVQRVITGEPVLGLDVQQELCAAGQFAQWDGVGIKILHPGKGAIRQGNNSSCVVEIRAGNSVALLTGDIELPVERELLRGHRLEPAELLVVPHHGSRTSSHSAFVARLEPQVAIVSAGFENRWGFPKDDVVKRWQAVGSEVVNTATAGAISYRLCAGSGIRLLGMHRRDNRRIWND